MSTQPTPWHKTFHALLLHPDGAALWLVEGASGWVLPTIVSTQPLWIADTGQIRALFEAALGCPLWILRLAQFDPDEAAQRYAAFFEMTLPTGDAVAGPGRWVGAAELDGMALAQPAQRRRLQATLHEAGSAAHPLRLPWARLGWREQAAAWVDAHLARQGLALSGPPEQVRAWALSTLWRLPLAGEYAWFKATTRNQPLFANEGLLMARLAERFPTHVPAPLAVEPQAGWMLMADFGPSLRESDDASALAGLMAHFAAMQQATVGQESWLLGVGCLDRGLARLAEQAPALLTDAAAMAQLGAAQASALHAAMPLLLAMLERLRAFALPATLIHGDLHLGNVARRGDGWLFYDWTDAAISHPFFDLLTLRPERDASDALRAAWPTALEGYLACWQRWEPLARLREAWWLAERVACLHHAVSYQHIANALEPQSEQALAGALGEWIELLLERLPADAP